MFRVVLLGFLVFSVSLVVMPTQVYAISLDDEEEDAEDVADLLDEAKQAAKSESFSKADALLKKAKMYGTGSSDVGEAEQYVSAKKRARDERLERERKERERLARLKREKEERAREARLKREREARLARQNSDSNYGLPKSMCYRVSSSYALYKYCTTGSCDGFVSNYALHQLCKYNKNAFYGSDRKANINLYLRNGGYLSYDYFSDKATYQSGKFNGSFQERKNFILYLLNGMTLIKY
jgi:hypothetical protein